MNDITPKEASEILSHYTDLGYGIVIEGEDTSKIKQALSLASKTLANGTPIDKGDLVMFNLLMTTIADKGLPFEEVLLLIDNAKTPDNPSGDTISRGKLQEDFKKELNFESATAYIRKLNSLEKTDLVKLMLSLIDNAQAVEPFTQLEKEEIADAINYLLGAELLEENGYTEEVINALKSALKKVGGAE